MRFPAFPTPFLGILWRSLEVRSRNSLAREWRPRWGAIWQHADSWHCSSRAIGTILAGLGHLPRNAGRCLVHMPLILGRRDPEGVSLQGSSLLRCLPGIRQDAFLPGEGWHLPSPSPIAWAGTGLAVCPEKSLGRGALT